MHQIRNRFETDSEEILNTCGRDAEQIRHRFRTDLGQIRNRFRTNSAHIRKRSGRDAVGTDSGQVEMHRSFSLLGVAGWRHVKASLGCGRVEMGGGASKLRLGAARWRCIEASLGCGQVGLGGVIIIRHALRAKACERLYQFLQSGVLLRLVRRQKGMHHRFKSGSSRHCCHSRP